MVEKKGNVFDYVKSILRTGEDLSDYEVEYVPFVINRALSSYIDCVMYANDMNCWHDLPNTLQYKYLMLSIRKMYRPFQGWTKKEDDKELEIIQQYYNYSSDKAHEVKKILTKEQINELERELIEGKGGIYEEE